MDRRTFMTGAAGAALIAATKGVAAQDAFPTRAITIINAFPPGGANDIVTRPLAATMEGIFKHPVVVETKAGAAGQVGAQVAAAAKADGYSILSHNNGISGYAEVDKLFGRQAKTTRADFIPLGRLSADPVLLVVNEQSPWKTLEDFIADVKKRPESFIYSSGGLYGATHLPVALTEKALGFPKLRHLPTNGGGPAITSLLGNNVQFSVQSQSATISHIRGGKLRPLVSLGGQRSKTLPDLRTMKELGHDVEYYLWVGIFAPKGTPAPIVATLDSAIAKATGSDQFKNAVANAGLEGGSLNAVDFTKFWAADAQRADEAVQLIGKVQG